MLRIFLWSLTILISAFFAADAVRADGVKQANQAAASESAKNFVTYGDYYVNRHITPFEGETYRTGIFRDWQGYDTIFRIVKLMMSNQKYMPNDIFESHMILYYIEWDKAYYRYTVRDIIADGQNVTVKVTAERFPSDMTIPYPSPLVLQLPKTDPDAGINYKIDFIGPDQPVTETGRVVDVPAK